MILSAAERSGGVPGQVPQPSSNFVWEKQEVKRRRGGREEQEERPAARLTAFISWRADQYGGGSTTATTSDCNNNPPTKVQLDLLTPFNPTNAASSFTCTTTVGQFKEGIADEGDSLRRMRSNNVYSAQYLQPPPKAPTPPQPTSAEGCVDLEKVNLRLLELVRRARAEKERLEARERIERKAEMRRALREEKILEKVVKAVNHVPRGEEPESSRRREESLRRQDGSNRDSYAQAAQGYPPQILQLRSSQSMNVLMRSSSPPRTISPSPWSLLGKAHTKINLPALSHSLSPASPQHAMNPEQHQRGSYDRPDWSESDENVGGSMGRGAGLRVSTGLKLLAKKSESVLRRGGGGRSKEAVTVGVMEGIPERRVVMRMQNDSVISREVARGWRCGCLMK
ncbi:hypothetical protein EV426DRAFT_700668 [Tirmania nivea]|nr:hypothetical protein EV426DRAFT_700668 [Tirmania nivea]